ncbi:MAG: hypothetical protein IPK50_12915 [Fibrobacterota bacterium]|nr:hypothetical protein [Fibrobacterota bacterium]QQS03210.1 MAG: hypothetical protein IPK50_12915 [Fibrobacterota bacterium]
MRSFTFAILATTILYSCNSSEMPSQASGTGASISPRLMLSQGVNLPVTDSVHIKVWSTTPSSVWFEKTIPWNAKFVVISGIPQGTNFLFSIEGRKAQPDGSSAIWWNGTQSGTTNSSQSFDPVDLPVWLSIGDTLSPVISGLKDTIIDSAIAGVRLRWTVTDNSIASVWFGSKKVTLNGDAANDTVSVGVGGSTSISVKAIDNAGNIATKSVAISRRSNSTVTTLLNAIPWNTSIKYDNLYDSRDGKHYRTVLIGNQKWMAENLNFSGTGPTIGRCYNDSPDSCVKYGRLYNWSEVMDGTTSSSAVPSGRRGVCPTGWHVPSNAEWDTLIQVTDKTNKITGVRLKSNKGWYGGAVGNDTIGFRAIPAGYFVKGSGYRFIDSATFFASSTESSTDQFWGHDIYGVDSFINHANFYKKNDAFSLRCVSDTAYGSATPISKDSVLPQDANTIGLWNFDEATGASIKNVKTGTTGVLTGGFTWIDGLFGKAVQFDGVSGYANLNFDPPEANVSFEMIANIQRDTGWLFTLWGAYNSGIALETNGFLSPEFMSVWATTKSHLNQSVYLALTIDSNRMGKLYINGFLAGSGVAIDSYSWHQTVLASYTGSAGFVKCSFEKFRISSSVRSELEISSMAKKIGLSNLISK